ncbi:4'-phosphopantetheinyl transferase [Streptomyces sp. NPDC059639]|uniref:4'-phosphopantetheinyl transferase family protein n=1 Tax=Streptomyces sp. NPDC059639 TaxID=3346891 RepID=UPI003686A95D
MWESVLPASVTWVWSGADRLDIELFPQEEAALVGASAKRRAEFTTVRTCAREALHARGHAPAPLLPGERGAPRWPDGMVGSMTHCAGHRAVAVADAGEVAALGIDAEPHAALPEGVLDRIARSEELAALRTLSGPTPTAWDRVLFSAKESVYKAWFPLVRRRLGWRDVSVTFAEEGAFTARFHVQGPELRGGPLTGFSGRWAVAEGTVLTGVVVDGSA